MATVLLLLASASGARAQEAAPRSGTEQPAPPPPLIAPEEVVASAAETERGLRVIEQRSSASAEIEGIARRLEELDPGWREAAAEALARLATESSYSLLSETGRVWSARERQVAEWNDVLSARVAILTRDLDGLDEQRERWKRTRDQARAEPLPDVLRETIDRVLHSLDATRSSLRERREAVLAVQSTALEEQRRIADVLHALDRARSQARSRLLARDGPNLWEAVSQWEPERVGWRLRATWREVLLPLRGYASDHASELVLGGVLLFVLVAGIAHLGRRAAQTAATDEGFASTARMLGRPVSAALLVLLIVYPVLLPTAPVLVRWLFAVLVLMPALRLVGPLLEGPARRAFYLLSGWYAVSTLRELLLPLPLLVRFLLLLEAGAAAVLLVWLLRSGRFGGAAGLGSRARALVAAGRVALALMGVSLLANLVGNVSLAEVLLEGTLLAAFAAAVLQGSALVLLGLWSVLLHTRPLNLLRGVQRHEPLLRRRGSTLIAWGLVFLWLWFTLGFFQLREPFRDAFSAVLAATWPVGELELSLGDVVAFVLTVWLTVWLSRFVRFVLDEDVLSRADLPRGVPYAISSVSHYLILLFGFLIAISAAGFDMSRFALIVGALGVGIGIGLQDVVNNFVSGVILLFERPVQPGDTVQVGDLFGEVRRIGMRSSTVRTWSGAEVIVPNSKLVSDNVVNWTLSDRLRRIEIPIGVAYGTDPERVLALLVEVARVHPGVLAEPAPNALFLAHGNSSLDFELRAWTASPDWYTLRSDLSVGINRALGEAGIAIPFPQRDLHLRSVDPGVREALRAPHGERGQRPPPAD